MTPLDWFLIIVSNGAIVAYGFRIARGTKSSADWFLAARGLPWWMVGLSMFATAVDSGDYVAIVGGAYTFGLTNITTWWLGLPIGWFVVSYVVFLPLYRSGMFTNAEYLEYRFGPAARLLSALIQIQYRSNILGNIAFSLYLTFSILTGWGPSTWGLVIVISMAAAAYTATGGLKSVAVTDALQSIIMMLASILLWVVLWNAVGGWQGLEARLTAISPELAESMLRVGGRREPGVPPVLMIFGWIIVHVAYCVVNHSQAMRLLAARSEWDMKMAAFVASVLLAAIMWFNITLGILGRAVLPDTQVVDEIFPRLIHDYLGAGLVGLVVAGLLAGGISTYDSIGSSLAALFTRDIYARFLVRGKDDGHYLRVSRWTTPVIIAASFGYVPFLKSGMLVFYLRVTSVAVIPLCTVYLMGTLTRVHRRSGTVGLAAGMLYGLSSLLGEFYQWPLPTWWTNTWWAYPWSIAVTAGAMLSVTAVLGWAKEEAVRSLTFTFHRERGHETVPEVRPELVATQGTWLESTRQELPPMRKYPFPLPPGGLSLYLRPFVWALLFLTVIGYVNLVLLW